MGANYLVFHLIGPPDALDTFLTDMTQPEPKSQRRARTHKPTLALGGLTGRFVITVISLIGLVWLPMGGSFAKKRSPKPALPLVATAGASWSLNGQWWMTTKTEVGGLDRHYDTTVSVPGIQLPPNQIGKGPVWFLTYLDLTNDTLLPTVGTLGATIRLNGARFCPAVYINGQLVGHQGGGMAPTDFVVPHRYWRFGQRNSLEVRLLPLSMVPATDASKIPPADQWRSHVSACLWDDVSIRWHQEERHLRRVVPALDSNMKLLKIGINVSPAMFEGSKPINQVIRVVLRDKNGRVAATDRFRLNQLDSGWHTVSVRLPNSIIRWSPDRPYLYQLETGIETENEKVLDQVSFPYGFRFVGTDNQPDRHGLVWNGRPFEARSISVVWHRWVRDPEAKPLAYDQDWFRINILQRSKDIGANTMRFHLGTPPERYLNWCDSMGFAVQYEWLFFHGMKADTTSLKQQWRQWLDLAARHPSVAFIHPWNETEGPELKTAWHALNRLLPDYQRLVVAERDMLHVHKYWWGLFENLGLYYDKAAQFGMPIMVDEFGGNYLDGNGDLGGYKTLRESFARFLGPAHTKAQRLRHHTIANGRVAEYWRRIGAAGFSPFCALGSPEDGNHWFLGPLRDGKPKPVWAALTPAYSTVAVSLDIWDRHYLPNQQVSLPITVINNKPFPHQVIWQLQILNQKGQIISRRDHSQYLSTRSKVLVTERIMMPKKPGNYTLRALLKNPPKEVKMPVISSWDIKVISPVVPAGLHGSKADVIYIHPAEKELLAFAQAQGLRITGDPKLATKGLASAATWSLAKRGLLTDLIPQIKHWVWLDMGPQGLGQGYPLAGAPSDALALGPLQAVATVAQPRDSTYQLLPGLKLQFAEVAEPESNLHPDTAAQTKQRTLKHLDHEDLWLFNGMRGGLAVPAWDMKVLGLRAEAVRVAWVSRGADAKQLASGKPYYAYELNGYYAFSASGDDKGIEKGLRDRVRFLMEDAPALRNVLNPDGRINKQNLSSLTAAHPDGAVVELRPLLCAGKGLTKTPTTFVRLANGQTHIFSQLMTRQRLASVPNPDPNPLHNHGAYTIGIDPVAQQLVLNWLAW